MRVFAPLTDFVTTQVKFFVAVVELIESRFHPYVVKSTQVYFYDEFRPRRGSGPAAPAGPARATASACTPRTPIRTTCYRPR